MAKITVKDLDKVKDQVNETLVDDDGFIHLEMNDRGRELLERVVVSKRKKIAEKAPVTASPKIESSNDTAAEVPEWDLDTLDHDLDWAVKKVQKSQFDKVIDKFEHRQMLDAYIDHVIEDGIQTGDTYDLELSIIDRAIRIGKTFFEYFSDNEEGFITNVKYDQLMPVLKRHEDEPTGYTPEGKRGKVKVQDNVYDSLAINTNKCYILRTDDNPPEGVKENDSVEAWLKRCYKDLCLDETDDISVVTMPKLDGVALRGEIDSENRLNTPLMRGDGKDSVLVKGLDGLKMFEGDPISDTPFGCQFEAFVTYEDLTKVSEYMKRDVPYASPRHAASGIINTLAVNPDDKLIKFLSFYPINTVDLEGDYVDRLQKIEQLGNVDVLKTKVLTGNKNALLEKISRRFRKMKDARKKLPYAIDGMVLTLASDKYQQELGRSGRTNKWQIAYKFDPTSEVGEVKGIELSSGKKGFRTIQIVLKEPVVIDGVCYDHIPALSADIFEKMDLREGDLVMVSRVGDVIPSISIKERRGGKKLGLPTTCPSCGKEMIWEAKKLKCVNPDCVDNKAGALLTFFQGAGIDGVGEVEAKKLVNAGLQTIGDIIKPYDDNSCDKWAIAGYKDVDAIALQSSIIVRLGELWDYEFIGICGIPGVGRETAKSVFINNCSDRYTLQNAIMHLIEGAHGKLSYMYSDIAERFCKKSTPEHFANLKSVGHTGGNPSKETQKLIRDLGWELVDGKKFDYLIVPSYDHESTKTKYAKDKGKEIFTEEDFVEEFSEEI